MVVSWTHHTRIETRTKPGPKTRALPLLRIETNLNMIIYVLSFVVHWVDSSYDNTA